MEGMLGRGIGYLNYSVDRSAKKISSHGVALLKNDYHPHARMLDGVGRSPSVLMRYVTPAIPRVATERGRRGCSALMKVNIPWKGLIHAHTYTHTYTYIVHVYIYIYIYRKGRRRKEKGKDEEVKE